MINDESKVNPVSPFLSFHVGQVLFGLFLFDFMIVTPKLDKQSHVDKTVTDKLITGIIVMRLTCKVETKKSFSFLNRFLIENVFTKRSTVPIRMMEEVEYFA